MKRYPMPTVKYTSVSLMLWDDFAGAVAKRKRNWRGKALSWSSESEGSGEFLDGVMVSELLSGVLQTPQALQVKAQSYYLGKIKLQKLFNKRRAIIVANMHGRININFIMWFYPSFLRQWKLRQELRVLRSQFKQGNEEDKSALAELRNIIKRKFTTTRRAEWHRKGGKERAHRRAEFVANPFGFTRRRLG